MAKQKLQIDWWKVNGWFWVVVSFVLLAIAFLEFRFWGPLFEGFLLGFFLLSVFLALLGVALLKRRMIAILIAFVISGTGFFWRILQLFGFVPYGFELDFNTIMVIMGFALAIMLLKQIWEEKGKK